MQHLPPAPYRSAPSNRAQILVVWERKKQLPFSHTDYLAHEHLELRGGVSAVGQGFLQPSPDTHIVQLSLTVHDSYLQERKLSLYLFPTLLATW